MSPTMEAEPSSTTMSSKKLRSDFSRLLRQAPQLSRPRTAAESRSAIAILIIDRLLSVYFKFNLVKIERPRDLLGSASGTIEFMGPSWRSSDQQLNDQSPGFLDASSGSFPVYAAAGEVGVVDCHRNLQQRGCPARTTG